MGFGKVRVLETCRFWKGGGLGIIDFELWNMKYFKFLLLGVKFLQILYKAFSDAFLKTLKLTCLLEIFKP